MTDPAEIARSLTKAQREAVASWRWKGWVAIRADIAPLMPTGLVDVCRFPMRQDGTRKARLNRNGLAVRAILQEQSNG